ncbi:MAG TPA: AmmeMemoRadiSam system protein B [Candidatus Aminicenantes bacterium]|nr:MAG: AmmeMemoRadiSam system protein B [Candidatus Aminicenantes bacterium]HEK86691.1 AmmeMemoRadiSam system protein B [Candidatus Aminicenantes bacterium]
MFLSGKKKILSELQAQKEDQVKREPYVAGYFYPDRKEILIETIESFIPEVKEKIKALGVVSPHAGYEYSGPVAAAVYSAVIIPETVVILAPAHHQINSLFALYDSGSWLTPLGQVPIEERLSELLVGETQLITRDREAHRKEHSIEVQVPFLQYFQKNLSLVPILVSYQANYESLAELGQAISRAVINFDRPVLLVASTDMSHYVSQKMAEELDHKAISFIERLDPQGLFQVVISYGLSMCGFQPTAAMLVAAKALGAKEGKLIKYQTSGDRTGDYREVVGYAGLAVI